MKIMKTIIREISKWTSILISVLMLTVAYGDDKEDGAPEEPVPAAPTITNFVPPHGVPGVTITITGTGLKEANEVTIGGKQVELTGEATDTEIKVVTTEEVTGGKIKVTTPYGTAETVSEFVVDAVFQTPSLTVVPQDNVSYWDIITLEGENLDIVEKVFFGTVEARIIREDEATRAVESASGTELKVEVPYYDTTDAVNIFLEYTNEDNESVKMDTQKSFTVTPRAPKLDAVSSIDADFFDQISLTGTDLHLVEKVLFGTAEAVIDKENSNSTVLKVTVPYYEEEEPVTITLVYRYGPEDNVAEGRKSESSDKFDAKKVQPEDVECPESIMPGTVFEITGKNLLMVETVKIGDYVVTIDKEASTQEKLVCSLPGDISEGSSRNNLVIVYWNGMKTKTVSTNIEIKVQANIIIKNVVLTTDNGTARYYSLTTGKYYTASNYTEVQDTEMLVEFSRKGGANDATNNYNRINSSVYKNNVAPRHGFPLFFRRLNKNVNTDEKPIVDFIKGASAENVENTPITMEKMLALGYDNANADGSISGTSKSREYTYIDYKLNDDSWNDGTQSATAAIAGIQPGDIQVVVIRKSNKSSEDRTVLGLGFIEMVSIDKGETSADPNGDAKTASWTVNLYFPKDILSVADKVIRE